MILTADYHTHTVYSHGKGSVLSNALFAKSIGLKEIGISDHGFSHPAFGLSKRKLPDLILDCKNAENETGVKVLTGIESNLIGDDGTCDLKKENFASFDIFLVGIHKFVLYKPNTFFKMFVPNFVATTFRKKEVSKSLVKENTKAYINAIKKNPIDIITHINFCCFSDPVEVAKVARDYGTLIELNSKKVHLSDEELYRIIDTGVNFVISSDAHTPNRVGEISLVEDMLKRVPVPSERIMNIDGKTPDFRFKKFKENL